MLPIFFANSEVVRFRPMAISAQTEEKLERSTSKLGASEIQKSQLKLNHNSITGGNLGGFDFKLRELRTQSWRFRLQMRRF